MTKTTPNTLGEYTATIALATMFEPGNSTLGKFVTAHGPERALEIIESNEHTDNEETLTLRALMSPNNSAHALDLARKHNITPITRDHEHWPHALDALGDAAPLELWTKGNLDLLNTPITAISGSRASTNYGESVTQEITAAMINRGQTVATGGAYGVESVVLRTALVERATSIAVLGGGLDRLYPTGNQHLFEQVETTGLLVSEVTPGHAPNKWRFLRRNEILAAIADHVIVTEAGRNTGSLNLAMHALALGKPVGAVPGPITSPASAGCHRLIKEFGAVLIGSTQDARDLTAARIITRILEEQLHPN